MSAEAPGSCVVEDDTSQYPSATHDAPSFAGLTDLAAEKYGSKILFATDEWFAVAENLFKGEPVFDPNAFTEFGKEMDGWESRRRRTQGHDWCIIELGLPGYIVGVDIDTANFTGNFAPGASVQAMCFAPGEAPTPAALKRPNGGVMGTHATVEQTAEALKLNSDKWTTIVPPTRLASGAAGTRHSYVPVSSQERWTHLRLNQFPDGGIARLRVYGRPDVLNPSTDAEGLVELSAAVNGGQQVCFSDSHYGRPSNLIAPDQAVNMGDGWETSRRMDRPAVFTKDAAGVPQMRGNEWCILQLGKAGQARRLTLDSLWFKGNYPESVAVEGINAPTLGLDAAALTKASGWFTLLPRTPGWPNAPRDFTKDQGLVVDKDITHIRVTIFPDGGLARLRLWGVPA